MAFSLWWLILANVTDIAESVHRPAGIVSHFGIHFLAESQMMKILLSYLYGER